MTTTMTGPSTVVPRFPGMRVTQGRVIQSEWTKFRSLRSTRITLLVSVILTIGIAALFTAVTANRWSHLSADDRASFNPVVASLNGVRISQLAVGVLGVLLISGEYATGMIRASMTVVPRRLPVLWGKFAVFIGVVGVASLVSTFVAFFLGQSLLSSKHLNVAISSPGALRMVIGAGVYLLLVGITGMALGGLLRNTAAGISTLVGLYFVIPPITELLPSSWSNDISPYLPSNAGEAFWGRPDIHHLSPWAGLAVLCAWTAVAVVLAAVRLVRADA
ncbi:ABC transporter permease [Frankia tisae]|uniref:ABC transporter permease n=1 Tax=Frankia tisae TaxID=2950104 RepID=UPI0021C04F7F|nr:ABC transporter permease [Frankia tisae]